MKIILIQTMAIFTSSVLAAQPVLSDRWKETQRLDLNQKPISYSDTMKLQHVTPEEMSIVRGSFLYKGRISNDVLELGNISFGIMKHEQNEIRLQDESSIHVFTREIKDMTAADAEAGKMNLELPANPVTDIDTNLLKGNWEAYKRTSRQGPLQKVDYKTLIKSLSFNTKKTGNYYGSATTDFIEGTSFYFIKALNGSMIITEDKNQAVHPLKVWKLSATELIIEDDAAMVYYMKHFR